MEDMLSSVLETGEEVLWRGKPETFETLDKTNKPAIVKSEIIKLVISVALIIAYIVAAGSNGAGIKPGIIIIILAVMAYALASPFLHANTLRRKVEYVITNQRLITIKDEAKGVEFDKIKTADIDDDDIVKGIEAIDLCMATVSTTPDLIIAPGWSHTSTVQAVMAAKAEVINGILGAKSICDIDCSASGARSYDAVAAKKSATNLIDPAQIAVWPQVKLGNKQFHLSTQLAGLMAKVDSGNDGVPYESPSNKNLQCDGACLEDGTAITLTLEQANILNANGICTALRFMNGWVAWGDHTACYPSNTDIKDYYIPISRMFKWVGNSLIKTFWSKTDSPMNRRLLDNIKDSANNWLAGLVGSEYLLGARVEILDSENPMTDLMAGIVRIHIYMTPPSPAQEIDFVLEYDTDYVQSALA